MNIPEPNSTYGEQYYRFHCGEVAYQRNEQWLGFFDGIAQRIASDLNPTSVLDAGCALGMLVEGLRRRGVEAWGIDISEFAINNVAPEITPFCKVASILDHFPQQYDLIVSIEVLEHLPPADASRAVENLCKHSNNVLISTSPVDYTEPTHINVQQPDYWARKFASAGFFHDLDFDASFITPWAALYRRKVEELPEIIQSYERRLWHISNENRALRETSAQIFALRENIEQQNGVILNLHTGLQEKEKIIQNQNEYIQTLHRQWNDLTSGTTWKLIQHLQSFRLRIAPTGSRRETILKKLMRS